MVKDEESSKVYTTRTSGELRERLSVYIENSPGTTSENINELLTLGLDVKQADEEPDQLKQEIKDMNHAGRQIWSEYNSLRKQYQQERKARLLYEISAGITSLTVMGILIFITVQSQDYLGPFSDRLNNIVAILSAVAFLVGMFLYFGTALSPGYQRLKTAVEDLIR